MARPIKSGLDYFSLDVQFEPKIKMLEVKTGMAGIGILTTLWQDIYSQGYWIKFGKDELDLFCHEHAVEESFMKFTLDEMMNRNIFDSGLYGKYGILTSKGIQKRYFEVATRRKRVEVVDEFVLIDIAHLNSKIVNVDINSINVDINPKDVDINSVRLELMQHDVDTNKQSKVKESKVKESRVKETKVNESKHSIKFDEKMFNAFMEAFPNVENPDETLKAFSSLNIDEDLFMVIAADIIDSVESGKWDAHDGMFAPASDTYLKERMWENSARQAI